MLTPNRLGRLKNYVQNLILNQLFGTTTPTPSSTGLALINASARSHANTLQYNPNSLYYEWRTYDTAMVGGTGGRAVFYNAIVNSGRAEVNAGAFDECWAILTNVTVGPGDQTGATRTDLTYNDAMNSVTFTMPQNGVLTSCILRDNQASSGAASRMVNATYADFTAAGGSIGVDAWGYQRIYWPATGIWVVMSDAQITLTAGAKFAWQTNCHIASTSSFMPISSVGDLASDYGHTGNTANSSQRFSTLNWGAGTGASLSAYARSGLMILMPSQGGEMVLVEGDSRPYGNGDNCGDANHGIGYVSRAMANKGYSSINLCVSGSAPGGAVSGANPVARWVTTLATTIYVGYGSNSADGSGAIGDIRAFILERRPLLSGRKRVIWERIAPKQATGYYNSPAITSIVSGGGTTATVTTPSTHGLSVGQQVVIYDPNIAGYNGATVVASVPSTTTFTFACPAGLADDSATGLMYAKQLGTWNATNAQFLGALDQTKGDPDLVYDMFPALGIVTSSVVLADLRDLQDNAHFTGNASGSHREFAGYGTNKLWPDIAAKAASLFGFTGVGTTPSAYVPGTLDHSFAEASDLF